VKALTFDVFGTVGDWFGTLEMRRHAHTGPRELLILGIVVLAIVILWLFGPLVSELILGRF
jgi:hypothetical protein